MPKVKVVHLRITKLLCYFTFFISSISSSEELKGINITMWGQTYHIVNRDRYENNNIFGLAYKNIELGTMTNSFKARSYMVTYHYKYLNYDRVELGIRLGGMTGYTNEQNPVQVFGVTPIVSPTLLVELTHGLAVELSLQTDVLVYTLNYRF